ncbi:thiolase C-terminal domain-containing protein [Streptomyces sp. NPDC091649]|uniref:thiolase C-terminal domain-containing protein n=1 Tax=Streptomyces sp. NPDC091649 TaxID=3366004 RepID=UPI0038147BEB
MHGEHFRAVRYSGPDPVVSASLPGPYLATTLTSAVLHRAVAAGSGALGGPLRELAAGGRTAALALAPGTLTATPDRGGHRLDGAAPPVLSADAAELLLLPAATPHGERWFLVDAGAKGLLVRPHRSVDPTRPTAGVRADAVHVPARRAVAVDDPALVGDLAAVLLAADACGTAARSLDTAVAHAAVREQFGRPVGAFQAVKHLCADMLVRLEQARALTWDAARAAGACAPAAGEPDAAGSGGGPGRSGGRGARTRGLAAALAAATAPEAAYTCAKDAIQVLGGIGFTWEHDAHLQLRRAVLARQLLGSADTHRLRAARLAEGGARRELALELPADAARHRAEARPRLAAARGLAPAEARHVLAATGYAAPHLPAPYGLGAGPVQQLAIQRESREQGIRLSDLSIATWVVPSLLAYGTEEQRERYLPATLRGDLQWCQLFSEPEAGSDLAALRTRAVRTEEGWRITGQKVWTSAARTADHGILLARTDPDARRHRGLTYFLVDMKNTEGIDIRPLKEITGEALFSEASFASGSCIDAVGAPMSRSAARQVYAASGLGPDDLDVIELHDCFSVNELLTYEALGLCGEGESGELVESGATTYGGRWVVNPSGGLISKGHPLGATGLAQAAELTWQLRGEAGARQVPGARTALAHNIGLGGAAVVTLLRRG